MSFFNINFFNIGNTFQLLQQVPTPSTYSNIKLFGGATFDDLWGVKKILAQAEINALDFYSEPEWNVSTFLLAKFNNNLQGGNIISLPAPITNWLLLRKAQSEAKFTQLADLDDTVDTYVDYTARSMEDYTYQWIPVADDLIGEPLQADVASTDFTTVNLIDPLTGDAYSFCLDMQLSEIATQEDFTINQTKGKFDTTLRGNRRTKVGTIGVIASSNDSTNLTAIEQDRLFLEQLENFVLSDNVKLLKYPKGFVYKVQTHNWSMSKKDGTQDGKTVYKIAFEWIEVGDL